MSGPVTDLDHARYDRDGWMESALAAQRRITELEAELRRQMSGGAGRDVVNLLEKLKGAEELREAAENVYSAWACGEDWHREVRELGRVLGFKADPA